MSLLRRPLSAVLLAVLAAVAGCASGPSVLDPARQGPFFIPANVARDDRLPADLRRVVLLPVHAGPVAAPETAAELDAVLLAAVQRQLRFEAVALSREDCRRRFGAASFSSAEALPSGFLDRILADYGADAVIFTDLTVHRAYPPLALGLRAKLATGGRDVRLVWAFDETFAADDPAVANSVRHYHRQGERPLPFDLSPAALQSPSRFAAYAADAMFATLPPR